MRVNRKDNTVYVDVYLNPCPFDHGEEDRGIWKIMHKVICCIKLRNEELKYTVNPGFRTNYRSGPDWLEKVIEKIGSPMLAISWLVHDINYEGYLSRKQADALLYEMLLYTGKSSRIAELVYIVLRLFGRFNYEEAKNNEFIDFSYEENIKSDAEFFPQLDDFSIAKYEDRELLFTKKNYAFVKRTIKEISGERFAASDVEIDKFYEQS